jgi:hypothetical protein
MGPKRLTHFLTVSWQISTPRSKAGSSTFRNDSGDYILCKRDEMSATMGRVQGFSSAWDMLEINGQSFMHAVQEIRRVQTYMDRASDQEIWKAAIGVDRKPIIAAAEGIIQATQQLYARASNIAATRLKNALESNEKFTWTDLRSAMVDIDSRLRDELTLVKLFVLSDQESLALGSGQSLLGEFVSDRFPSMLFEIEEAAKCLALGRSTASAFHSMRALEVTIRALAAFLQIPDPTKPAERNWAVVLGAIKAKIDERYPAKSRMPGSEGAKVEALYATLDAIKNPWRNATMHTENVYQPHEANHILQCVNVFVLNLAQLCDENGVAL